MKTTIVTLVALSALALSPIFGAPRKMTSTTSSKSASSPSVSAAKAMIAPGQAGARKLVAKLTTTQKSKMLTLLNKGTARELSDIKGVSKTRATAIEKARPFQSIDEVIRVSGIGKGTVSEIVNHARSLTTTRKKPSSPASSSKKAKAKS